MHGFLKALIPILLLIILGYLLRRAKFLPEQAWAGLEKLTYFVLFPCLLIRTLGQQSLAGTPWPSILVTVLGTLTVSATGLIIFRKIHSVNDATFTSIFQGGVRFNTYIAFAAAQSLYGPEGLAMGSVAAGFMIVLINLLCVSVFAIWGKESSQGILPYIREIVSNPLIIACTAGWFLSLSRIGLPYVTGNVLEIIGRAALPLGLLAVGAALKPGVIRGHFKSIVVSSFVQFGVKPAVTAVLIFYTGLTGAAAGFLMIAFMTPTAPSAYILARQLGGDTETMASIITFQTILAFVLMPLLGFILLQ